MTGCASWVAWRLENSGSDASHGRFWRQAFPDVHAQLDLQPQVLTLASGQRWAYITMGPGTEQGLACRIEQWPVAGQPGRLALLPQALPRALPAREAAAAAPSPPSPPPRGTAILFHGHAGGKEQMLPMATALAAQGWRVLMPDAAGHGDSGGAITWGWRDAQDAAEAMARLAKAPLAWPRPWVAVGYSMGTVTAMHWAQGRDDLDAVALIAPQPPLEDAVVHVAPLLAPAMAGWVGEETLRAGTARALQRQGWPGGRGGPSALGSTPVRQGLPLWVLSGGADTVSPPAQARKLAARWPGPVALHELPDRSHAALLCADEAVLVPLRGWLLQTFP